MQYATSDKKKNLQRVRSGIETLITTYDDLQKEELLQLLRAVKDSVNHHQIFVHNSCWKKLHNQARDVEASASQSSIEIPSKRRQSHQRKVKQEFQWKENCFLCGKVCGDNGFGKWSLCDIIRKDKHESTRDKILELIGDKTDDNSLAIKCRVSSCSDLPAIEARYHVSCKQKLNLSSLSKSRSSMKKGRPLNEVQSKNFKRLCQWLEREGDLYSVNELFEQVRLLSNDPHDHNQIYSAPWYLKKKLQENYGDKSIFHLFVK